LLYLQPAAHRDHHAPARLELIQQRLRNMLRRCGNDDAIIGRMLRPPRRTVTGFHLNISITKFMQQDCSLDGQRFDNLHAVYLACHLGQNGCLIARSRAHLQHTMLLIERQQVCHQSHNVGLRYRLAMPDRQRVICIGTEYLAFGNKAVTRNLAHDGQHFFGNRPWRVITGFM